jgi:hypothetical protein
MMEAFKEDFYKIPKVLEKVKSGEYNENKVKFGDDVPEGQLGLGF